MDSEHYHELLSKLGTLLKEDVFQGKNVFLFGHCNATEVLADELLQRSIHPLAILDNNSAKYSMTYKGIPVCAPEKIKKFPPGSVLVCIAARAYEPMSKQLRSMGYTGQIERLVDYNSFADYSTSPETIARMTERLHRGQAGVEAEKKKYPGDFRLYCPFQALGDVFYLMSYLPYYLEKRHISDYVVFTVGNACAEVARLFGAKAKGLSQQDMDEQIQATIYARDESAYIPHQDRPYVNKLYKALYLKQIPLETIYKCGVFGLPQDTVPVKPTQLKQYSGLEDNPKGRSVILSPYAKSVSNISENYWENIIHEYRNKGFAVYTNVAGDEVPLEGTNALRVRLDEMQSAVERAGTFIGIRSGLCDVIRYAKAEKTALYPDAYYSDTRWKMVDMYRLEGWKNLVLKSE